MVLQNRWDLACNVIVRFLYLTIVLGTGSFSCPSRSFLPSPMHRPSSTWKIEVCPQCQLSFRPRQNAAFAEFFLLYVERISSLVDLYVTLVYMDIGCCVIIYCLLTWMFNLTVDVLCSHNVVHHKDSFHYGYIDI